MSAFIVQDSTINRIVAFLSVKRDGFHCDPARPFIKLGHTCIKEGDYTPEGQEQVTEARKALALALFEMNCRAVNARYSDKPARVEFHPEDFRYQKLMPPEYLQFVRHCSCLGYQCSEGDVPEEPLYKALRDAQHIAAMNIVSEMHEYDALPWE